MITIIEPRNFNTFYSTAQMNTDFTIRRELNASSQFSTLFGNTPSSLELLVRSPDKTVALRLSLFLFYDHPQQKVNVNFKWEEDNGVEQPGNFSIGFKDQHKLEYSIAGKTIEYFINTDLA